MSTPPTIVLTDDLLRTALLREPPHGLADSLAADLSAATARTRQQRRPWFTLPWVTIAGLAPTEAGRRRYLVGVVAMLMLIAALAVAITAIVGSQRRLPPPFGLARPGLIAADIDGSIVLTDATGRRQRTLSHGSAYDVDPRWSPNGRYLAYWSSVAHDQATLMLYDAEEEAAAPQAIVTITTEVRAFDLAVQQYHWPTIAWAPDSSRLAYTTVRGGSSVIELLDVRDSHPRLVADPRLQAADPAWSPDGATIAFAGGRYDDERAIYDMDADGSNVRRVTTSRHANFHDPTWAPDGRQIGYWTDEGGGTLPRGWVVAVSTGVDMALGSDPASPATMAPVFAPDGSRMAWLVGKQPADGLAVAAIGTTRVDRFRPTTSDGQTIEISGLGWSPDGAHLLIGGFNEAVGYVDRMYVFDLADGSTTLVAEGGIDQATWQRLAP